MDHLEEAKDAVDRGVSSGVERAQVHATIALVERLDRIAVAMERFVEIVDEVYDEDRWAISVHLCDDEEQE